MKRMEQLTMTLETIRTCLIMQVVQIQQVVTEARTHETFCTQKTLVKYCLIGSARKRAERTQVSSIMCAKQAKSISRCWDWMVNSLR
jgi:hypothetical protein